MAWCASPSHPSCHLLLGQTSPALMFASARKRDFRNDAATTNKENTDDYFLCLIKYKYTVTKNRFQTHKLQLSDSPEPVSGFKSVSFLLRHMHFYLLLYFYHWIPPTLSTVIIIRCSGLSSVFVADYIFRPCSGNRSKNSMCFSMMQTNRQIKFQTKWLKFGRVKWYLKMRY